MNRVWIALGASLVLTAPAMAQGPATECGAQVDQLAGSTGIQVHGSGSGGETATAPSAPATNESLGVGVMGTLESPGGIREPAGAAAGTAAGAEARRLQGEALLNEARAAADAGRVDECRDKLGAARPLLDGRNP